MAFDMNAADVLLDAPATPFASLRRPFTPAEIDAHPDADRIWATILLLGAAMETRIGAETNAALDEQEKATDGEIEDAESQGIEQGRRDVCDELARLRFELSFTEEHEPGLFAPYVPSDDLREALIEPLRELEVLLHEKMLRRPQW